MKKYLISLTAVLFLLLAIPAQTFADEVTSKVNTSETKTEVSAEATMKVENLVNRLEEIKAMDFTEMSSSDKKELRKEVRSIKKDLKSYGESDAFANAKAAADGEATRGVFISTGAAIIIVLLLILIL